MSALNRLLAFDEVIILRHLDEYFLNIKYQIFVLGFLFPMTLLLSDLNNRYA
jgi:hypothetical protein